MEAGEKEEPISTVFFGAAGLGLGCFLFSAPGRQLVHRLLCHLECRRRCCGGEIGNNVGGGGCRGIRECCCCRRSNAMADTVRVSGLPEFLTADGPTEARTGLAEACRKVGTVVAVSVRVHPSIEIEDHRATHSFFDAQSWGLVSFASAREASAAVKAGIHIVTPAGKLVRLETRRALLGENLTEEDGSTHTGRRFYGAPCGTQCSNFFFHLGQTDAVHMAGADAALYLDFQIQILRLLAVLSCLAIGVVAPVHAFGGDGLQDRDTLQVAGLPPLTIQWSFSWTTTQNLPAQSPALLWVDVLVFYLYSICLFVFIWRFRDRMRREITQGILNKSAAAACTALVHGIPTLDAVPGPGDDESSEHTDMQRVRRTRDQLVELLQRVYGKSSVVSCFVVPKVYRLGDLEKQRLRLVGRRRWCELQQQALLAPNSSRSARRSSIQDEGVDKDGREGSTGNKLKLPSATSIELEANHLLERQRSLGQHVLPPSMIQLEEETIQELRLVDEQIAAERSRGIELTGQAFVTFIRPKTRQQFVADFGRGGNRAERRVKQNPSTQKIAEDLRWKQDWSVRAAPGEFDVRWENLRHTQNERRVRTVLMHLALVVVLMFFTTPVTILNQIQNLVGDEEVAGSASAAGEEGAVSGGLVLLQNVATLGEDWPEFIRTAVFDFAPSIGLMLLLYGVLSLLEIPAQTFEKHHLWTDCERSIAWKTFIVLLLNLMILPALAIDAASTFVVSVANTDYGLYESALQVGKAGTSQMSYFCTLLISGTFVSCSYHLLRSHEIVLGWLISLRARTPDEQKVARDPWPHEYGYHLGNQMVIFTIGLSFGLVAPLMIPLTGLYFLARHHVDKYNLIYARNPKFYNPESCNRGELKQTSHRELAFFQMNQTANTFLAISIIVFQLVNSVFFMAKAACWDSITADCEPEYALTAACVGLVVVSVVFFVYGGVMSVCSGPSAAEDSPDKTSYERKVDGGHELRKRIVTGLGAALKSVAEEEEPAAEETQAQVGAVGRLLAGRRKLVRSVSNVLAQRTSSTVAFEMHKLDGDRYHKQNVAAPVLEQQRLARTDSDSARLGGRLRKVIEDGLAKDASGPVYNNTIGRFVSGRFDFEEDAEDPTLQPKTPYKTPKKLSQEERKSRQAEFAARAEQDIQQELQKPRERENREAKVLFSSPPLAGEAAGGYEIEPDSASMSTSTHTRPAAQHDRTPFRVGKDPRLRPSPLVLLPSSSRDSSESSSDRLRALAAATAPAKRVGFADSTAMTHIDRAHAGETLFKRLTAGQGVGATIGCNELRNLVQMLTAQGDGLVDETRDDEWLDDAVAAMSVRKDGRVSLDEFILWFCDQSRVAGIKADIEERKKGAMLWKWNYLEELVRTVGWVDPAIYGGPAGGDLNGPEGRDHGFACHRMLREWRESAGTSLEASNTEGPRGDRPVPALIEPEPEAAPKANRRPSGAVGPKTPRAGPLTPRPMPRTPRPRAQTPRSALVSIQPQSMLPQRTVQFHEPIGQQGSGGSPLAEPVVDSVESPAGVALVFGNGSDSVSDADFDESGGSEFELSTYATPPPPSSASSDEPIGTAGGIDISDITVSPACQPAGPMDISNVAVASRSPGRSLRGPPSPTFWAAATSPPAQPARDMEMTVSAGLGVDSDETLHADSDETLFDEEDASASERGVLIVGGGPTSARDV